MNPNPSTSVDELKEYEYFVYKRDRNGFLLGFFHFIFSTIYRLLKNFTQRSYDQTICIKEPLKFSATELQVSDS